MRPDGGHMRIFQDSVTKRLHVFALSPKELKGDGKCRIFLKYADFVQRELFGLEMPSQ